MKTKLDSALLALALCTIPIVFYFPPELPKRGFICGDPRLSYKYHENTVSTRFIIIYQQIIAFLILWFVEFLITNDDDNIVSRLKSSRAKAHKWFRDFLFTWSAMMIVLVLLKSIYGEHRPHFIDMCIPDTVNCTRGSLVTNFTCTNPNLSKLRLKEISRSFPSGHAALAVYFSVFMSWFLEKRLPKLRTKYFIPFLQTLLVVHAMICCVTRISDNAHHPNDVLFGILFGITFSTFNCLFVSENFKKGQNELESPKLKIKISKVD